MSFFGSALRTFEDVLIMEARDRAGVDMAHGCHGDPAPHRLELANYLAMLFPARGPLTDGEWSIFVREYQAYNLGGVS